VINDESFKKFLLKETSCNAERNGIRPMFRLFIVHSCDESKVNRKVNPVFIISTATAKVKRRLTLAEKRYLCNSKQ
jgi:hypothetical protein